MRASESIQILTPIFRAPQHAVVAEAGQDSTIVAFLQGDWDMHASRSCECRIGSWFHESVIKEYFQVQANAMGRTILTFP